MLTALIVLSVIVLFHEFGHFIFARIHGVTVEEFSVGFGPRLLTAVSKKSGTRYSLKLLPIGGSCAMLGEDEDMADEGAFNAKPVWARISIVAAGPIFNFILAFIFAFFIITAAGYDSAEIAGVTEGYSAAENGFQAGDVITGLNKRKVRISRDITMFSMINQDRPVDVTFERQNPETGETRTLHAVLSPKYSAESDAYMLGFQMNLYRTPTKNLLETLRYSTYEVLYWIRSVFDSFRLMFTGKVGADDMAGPVRIIYIIDNTVQETKEYGLMTVLLNLANFCVLFSANLGVLNLLPLPALDGGRLVFLFLEVLRGKPVDQRLEGAVHMTGMALLMALMVFIVFNDLKNIF